MSARLPPRLTTVTAGPCSSFLAGRSASRWAAIPIGNAPSRRTFISSFLERARNVTRGSSKQQSAVSDPLTEEFLKKKPGPPPPTTRGGLSDSSIFGADAPAQDASGGVVVRNPEHLAAVLDPHPEVRKRWERKMLVRELRNRGRLSKTQLIKRTERESLTKSHFMRISVKKLAPLARQIAGKPIEDAILQMRFSKKKASQDVEKHLEYARDEAIVRRGMGLGKVEGTQGEPIQIELKDGKKKLVTDRTGIYVDQAWVGRGTYILGVIYKAKGRIDTMMRPQTSISVLLKEEATRVRLSQEKEKKRRDRKVWVPLPDRPITAQRQYYSW